MDGSRSKACTTTGLHYGREQYRVRFAGYGRESDQWLDANLVTRDAIDEYWATVNGTQ